MDRRVRVSVGSVSATFRLAEELAPRSADAFWGSLPLTAALTHGKLSGDACYFHVKGGPLAALPSTPELPATSIYRGYMALLARPEVGAAEILISYGLAEYRWPTGRRYVTPIAKVVDADASFFEVLRRMHEHGSESISVAPVEPDA